MHGDYSCVGKEHYFPNILFNLNVVGNVVDVGEKVIYKKYYRSNKLIVDKLKENLFTHLNSGTTIL